MWACVICGSDKQPTCSIPNYKRSARKWLKRTITKAKTCSEVCRHEHQRRMARVLGNERAAAKEKRNAAREAIGNQGRDDDRVDSLSVA